MRCVDAYGLENETDSKIELWAKCYGVRLDPKTGQLVHGAPRVHDTLKDSVVIQKGPGWSLQRLTDSISRMTFFDPEGSRRWEQDLTPEGIH